MRKRNGFLAGKLPETKLVMGYTSYAIVGVILLSLPWSTSTAVGFLDNIFITISAISTTGLATVSVPDSYSFIGQLFILILIQLGGIGYMTFGSFVVLSTSQNLSSERKTVHRTAFSLPKHFSIKKFVKSIVIYTSAIEAIGAIVLAIIFWNDGRANPVWSGIFHSISSFCTAGFSIYQNSFENYADNIPLNITVAALSFLGAVGYIVMVDVWLLLKGDRKSITFTSKIILGTTFALFFMGSALLLLDYAVSGNSGSGALLRSLFQAMTALTTVGFNTVLLADMRSFSLFVLMILMIIGASPSGTGGGVKSTTISGIIGIIHSVFSKNKEYIRYRNGVEESQAPAQKNTIFSRLRAFLGKKAPANGDSASEETGTGGKDGDSEEELSHLLGNIYKIKLLGRAIPFERIIHAMATFSFYFLILFLGTLALLLSESHDFEQIFFEAASGLGTVGLSTGITGDLSGVGKVIISILMFIGRLGPITFGVYLFSGVPDSEPENENEDLVI